MGWFSNEEVITTNNAVCPQENHHHAQTIALCALAVVAVGYVLIKSLVKLHSSHTIRVAERVTRSANPQV